MKVVAYSICRRCAAVYPERRRCPACDGDVVAARAIASASAHAIEQGPPAPAPRRQRRAIAATVLFALVLALGATVAAIAAPAFSSGHATPSAATAGTGSTTGGAAQVRE